MDNIWPSLGTLLVGAVAVAIGSYFNPKVRLAKLRNPTTPLQRTLTVVGVGLCFFAPFVSLLTVNARWFALYGVGIVLIAVAVLLWWRAGRNRSEAITPSAG